MPELPEVETVRRELESIQDETIRSVDVRDSMLVEDPETVRETVPGWTIESLDRRGKYLLFVCDGGVVLFSLRMTGNVTFEQPGGDEHRYVGFELGEGSLYFTSVRRFSRVHAFESTEPDAVEKVEKLGIDPLNGVLDPDVLEGVFENRTAAVKTLLMNQELLAGIGNIYASEICFEADLAPDRSVAELDRSDLESLVEAIPAVLNRAIRFRGSSISDYSRPDGDGGGFQDEFNVYGRTGEACRRCDTPVQSVELSGRSTFFCPECQR